MLGGFKLEGRLRSFALLVVAALAVLAAPGVARADSATEWNLNAANALFVVGMQGPQQSVPHMAMVHGAIYDAVNAIDGGHEGYLLTSRVAQPFDSKEAAAAAAAHRVLLNIVPAQQAVLDAQYAVSLAAIPDGSAKTRGIAVGEAAAAAMIAARTDDGRFGAYRFPVGSGPGEWRPVLPAFVNDPNAWLKDVRPFLIESGTQFQSDGPLSLTSRKYAREFDEVKSVGSATSTTRTADQTLAARYWAENPPADLEPDLPDAVRAAGVVARRQRAPLRDAVHDRGRFADHGLERQGALPVLAADHGDPRGRHGRQSLDGGGSELAAADPDTALYGALVGSRCVSAAPSPRRCRTSSAPTRSAGRTPTTGA